MKPKIMLPQLDRIEYLAEKNLIFSIFAAVQSAGLFVLLTSLHIFTYSILLSGTIDTLGLAKAGRGLEFFGYGGLILNVIICVYFVHKLNKKYKQKSEGYKVKVSDERSS